MRVWVLLLKTFELETPLTHLSMSGDQLQALSSPAQVCNGDSKGKSHQESTWLSFSSGNHPMQSETKAVRDFRARSYTEGKDFP